MRTITSISSAYKVNAYFEIYITPTDASTTWVFNQNDILKMSPINYEIPFAGGFSKTTNYKVTLQSSVDWIKTFKSKVINAECTIEMYLNEDDFRPHTGIVTDYALNTQDLNLIELNIFDKFFRKKNVFPPALMSDSFDNLPPAVLNDNLAGAYYYGKHTRPIYYTAVNSHLSSFWSPKNVSSSETVPWYSINKPSGADVFSLAKVVYVKEPKFYTNPDCLQTNAYSDGFLISTQYDPESSNLKSYQSQRLLKFSEFAKGNYLTDPISESIFSTNDWERRFSTLGVSHANSDYRDVTHKVEATIGLGKITDIGGKLLRLFGANTNTDNVSGATFVLGVDSQSSVVELLISSLQPSYPFPSQDVIMAFGTSQTIVNSLGQNWAQPDNQSYFTTRIRFFTTGNPIGESSFEFGCSATILKEDYENRSIFRYAPNCLDIAVSENPLGILAHIFSESTLDFVVSQNSTGQTNTQSFNLQCYFDEQLQVSKIADEIGRMTATYLWVGDSGMIQTRTYQESSNVTINKTLTTSDFLDKGFTIKENPLGITINETDKSSNINLKYDFEFLKNNYNEIIKANKSNNAACNSIFASGIENTKNFTTKYIKETYTASLYLNNLVRKFTGGDTIIKASLGANHFDLELADVLKVEHPVLNNSSSIFQITKIGYDFQGGVVNFTANEIKNVS